MGRAARRKPVRLAEKLLQVRVTLGISQQEMVERLGIADNIHRGHLARYESGINEPPLTILLQYARLANLSTDAFIDDELDLPAILPSPTKHEGIKRAKPKRASHSPT